ncbi:MAG TPA: RIP metalloprotease RseP [Deltaproteobacteria bacterium]|nr:RIP metalloprotease RseP [Deltaproteobacteria bacterium]HPJ95404.1 RIP metalloprotease RseP [Deltaproteobacteria bacterium]HPR53366.1 RIP metalloprotease RseP [Deltaproteobacteria bacterium]
MTTLFAFVIVLGILIFFHELGHFLLAKFNGVGVLKFSLGFGPAIIKKRIGETEYRISAIPLGGYVKMLGEEPSGEEEITHIDLERSFSHKGLMARAAIVAAGPIFNLLLAVVIYTIIAWWGIPTFAPVVGGLLDDSPAYNAGLMAGDAIVSIDGNPVEVWDDISLLLKDITPEKKVEMIIDREGKLFTIHVKPTMITDTNIFGEEIERPMIGITRGEEIITKRLGIFSGLGYGVTKTYQVIELTGIAFWKIINGSLDIKKSLGGPILIAQVSGETFRAGMLPFFFMIAFVSINLGIINLLPIPILDGGHLLFFLIESITGKPIEGRPREIAQQIGLFLLILLMLFAFYNDLVRIFTGD